MIEKQFTALLRSFVQDTAPKTEESWNMAELQRAAAQQNMLPVLAYENKRWRLSADSEVCRRFDGFLYGAIVGNLNRRVDFETLSKEFTVRGIAHMPVKGYYLRMLYPVPELRTFGDIDMLIHREDRQKVHELMLSLGYSVKQNWEPTYSYIKGAEYYEIHTNLMDGNLDNRADLKAYFDAAWQYVEPDDGLRYRPDSDFHFIYTVCHLAKHLYSGGAGLRMYLDIALFMKNGCARLNMKNIERELAALQLTEFFHTVMNACSAWFGTECGCLLPPPDEAAIEKLLCYTLDSDLFGHSRDHAVIKLRNSESKKPAKGKLICNMLFPPAGEIESRYTFLQGRRWLLPLAWIVRAVSNFRLIPNRLHSMKSVAETDIDRVETYDGFMRRIGL